MTAAFVRWPTARRDASAHAASTQSRRARLLRKYAPAVGVKAALDELQPDVEPTDTTERRVSCAGIRRTAAGGSR